MSGAFHEGELEAQRRADVRDLADRVGRIIRPTINTAAAEFLAAQSMVIAATVSGDAIVHASALFGTAGFARATGEATIELRPASGHLDTLFADLAGNGTFGMLAIDFATKRRMRANGHAVVDGTTVRLSTAEVYGNCPQYIERREVLVPRFGRTGSALKLSETQRRIIAGASMFFIASVHPERGADASHRGGAPGFIHVEENRISWPDYSGNNMFNTIGNLLVNPRCGLLFIDFADGTTLQIEGTASLQWEPERRVEIVVNRCFETR